MNNTSNVAEKVEEPKVGMIFNTIDEAKEYYIRYGSEMGFQVFNRTSKKGDDGELINVRFFCNRACKEKHNPRSGSRIRWVNRTDCKANLSVAICPDGKWRVTFIKLDHNHELSPGKIRKRRCNKKVEMNDTPGYGNDSSLEKDCIYKVSRLRFRQGDASAIQSYVMKMQANNVGFFYTMDLDDEGRLKNIFWADARSRAAYEEFGDVVTFDTTYLTNKCAMPFVPFIGVNHHGQSTLLGCGLLSVEDTETFTWLFQSLLACMSDCAPKAIITDQDKAMKKAIEIVFPNTPHRWCLWHILKKLPKKLRACKHFEAMKSAFENVAYDSLTHNEFDEGWNRMIEEYNLQSNDWLLGLYDERHRWVPAFLKDTFWAGMSASQRGESMQPFFDGYVNSKTTLKQFVERYEKALRSKVEKENQLDLNSFDSCPPCITHYAIEKQFQDAYTTAKFKEFQQEVTGKIYCELSYVKKDVACSEYEISEHLKVGEIVRTVTFNVSLTHDYNIHCSCCLFEFRGILCRHALTVLIHNKFLRVPEKYIIPRWRRDLKRRHTKVKISYDWSRKPEACRFDMMRDAFCEVADLSTDSEGKTKMVMRWIDELKEELKRDEVIMWESTQPTITMNDGTNTIAMAGGFSPFTL